MKNSPDQSPKFALEELLQKLDNGEKLSLEEERALEKYYEERHSVASHESEKVLHTVTLHAEKTLQDSANDEFFHKTRSRVIAAIIAASAGGANSDITSTVSSTMSSAQSTGIGIVAKISLGLASIAAAGGIFWWNLSQPSSQNSPQNSTSQSPHNQQEVTETSQNSASQNSSSNIPSQRPDENISDYKNHQNSRTVISGQTSNSMIQKDKSNSSVSANEEESSDEIVLKESNNEQAFLSAVAHYESRIQRAQSLKDDNAEIESTLKLAEVYFEAKKYAQAASRANNARQKARNLRKIFYETQSRNLQIKALELLGKTDEISTIPHVQ